MLAVESLLGGGDGTGGVLGANILMSAMRPGPEPAPCLPPVRSSL